MSLPQVQVEMCDRCGHVLLWVHGELACARRGCDGAQAEDMREAA